MSTLQQRMGDLVRACFTGIWIQSFEPDEVLSELGQMCRQEGWNLLSWDIASGLKTRDDASQVEASDPLGVIKALSEAPQHELPTLLVLRNFHRYLGSAEVAAEVAKAVTQGKSSRNFIIVVAPVVQLPPELERLFLVIDHDLPNRSELADLLAGIATGPGEMPTGQHLETVIDAAAGLTRYEAENAYSLSLVRHGCIHSETIWELKTQALKKSGLLNLHRSEKAFDSLGGLTALKSFTKRALLRSSSGSSVARARGVLLLSPPGCGKSEFCKCLGQEVGRPVLTLDVGSLMGSLVGQSEERTREALRIIDSMAPCVVMIDEIEKAFAGAMGGSGDSGVSSRMFGTLLTWLNDHTSDVFVVCTANDVSRLPPEFSRAERFDGVFFVDLPSRKQKDGIWTMYRELFQISDEEPQPNDENWTGAEIRSCCRLAALLDVPLTQAAHNVVPVATTSVESVRNLREWASGRCLDAETGGVYSSSLKNGSASTLSVRRKISRDNSQREAS
jgi:hypothetical protein